MLVCNCLFKIRILSVCNNITKLARQHSPVIEVGMVMQANVLKHHFNFLNHNNKINNKKSSKQNQNHQDQDLLARTQCHQNYSA